MGLQDEAQIVKSINRRNNRSLGAPKILENTPWSTRGKAIEEDTRELHGTGTGTRRASPRTVVKTRKKVGPSHMKIPEIFQIF